MQHLQLELSRKIGILEVVNSRQTASEPNITPILFTDCTQ